MDQGMDELISHIRYSMLEEHTHVEEPSRLLLKILNMLLDCESTSSAISLLQLCPETLRNAVVNLGLPSTEDPLLHCAVKKGATEFITLMLDIYHASTEVRGIYKDERFHHVVTPLWVAAVSNQMEAVKLLISHGANINQTSDRNSTPVRAACYECNLDIVKYLVECGADINIPNIEGCTCLMNAVPKPELCDYLLSVGANIHVQDSTGHTALHYAVNLGFDDTARLLISRGADPYIKNHHGDDVFRMASMSTAEDLLESLISIVQPPIDKCIESYELMGTYFVDETTDDPDAAVGLWEKAMTLRIAYNNPKVGLVSRIEYGKRQEACTPSEMESLYRHPAEVEMQALLVRERILGSNHRETYYGVKHLVHKYCDAGRSEGIDLCFLAHKLHPSVEEPLHVERMEIIDLLCDLLWTVFRNSRRDIAFHANNYKLFAGLLQAVKLVCSELLVAGCMLAQKGGELENSSRLVYTAMESTLLRMLDLAFQLQPSEAQLFEIKRQIHCLAVAKLKESSHCCLLHVAVSMDVPRMLSVDLARTEDTPNRQVIALLLDVGFSVNCLNSRHQTPLHICAKNCSDIGLTASELDLMRSVGEDLLLRGAHWDISDLCGRKAYEGLPAFSIGKHMSLQCLAARVIKLHCLPYVGEVPDNLGTFIELH